MSERQREKTASARGKRASSDNATGEEDYSRRDSRRERQGVRALGRKKEQ